MKTILYFLLDQWADFEAAYLSTAVTMIGGGNFENKIVSLTTNPVKSIGGFSVLPDYDLNNVPQEYDALILIGGLSWHNEEAYQVKSFVEKTIKEGKLLVRFAMLAAFWERLVCLITENIQQTILRNLKPRQDPFIQTKINLFHVKR